jgi:hypothetical protein
MAFQIGQQGRIDAVVKADGRGTVTSPEGRAAFLSPAASLHKLKKYESRTRAMEGSIGK